MKLILTILFFLSLISAIGQTNYYVRTDGNNANTGLANTAGGAWLTVSFAAATVAVNDIINVGIGQTAAVFNEGTSQIFLKTGVTMQGVDTIQTKLVLNFYDSTAGNAAISMQSAMGTSGAQSINNIWIDGANIGYGAVIIRGRSNDTIRNAKFTGFRGFAMNFSGSTASSGPPSPYATGNVIENSTVTDCSIRYNNPITFQGAGSNIFMSGQQGMLYSNCIFRTDGKSAGANNVIVQSVRGDNKGVRFVNCQFIKPINNGIAWNSAIESWKEHGGMEITGCTFYGGGGLIDAGTGGSEKGAYAYSWWIHNNLFYLNAQLPTTPYRYSLGIEFEDNVSDAIIENNTFRNLGMGIRFSSTHAADVTQGHRINNNLFENIGFLDNSYGGWGAIYIQITAAGGVGRDINIYNNTIILKNGHSGLFLSANTGCLIRNITFTNNIVRGVTSYGYITFAGTNTTNGIDSVFAKNNISWLNNSSNNAYYRIPQTVGTVTNFETTENGVLGGPMKQDPLFVSATNFYLTPGSPAIGTGLDPPNTYRGAFPVSGTNISPVANAGADQTFNQGTSSTTLLGSGSDADGTISSYAWTQTAGPAATISNPSSATTNVSGLNTATTYTFLLTVTDNEGATDTDTMDIIVTPATAPGELQNFIITKDDKIYRPIL